MIKRFIHLFILFIMITIVSVVSVFSGCEKKVVTTNGAALDLQSRFEEAFEDSKDYSDYTDYSVADGTVRFEPATEPILETMPEVQKTEEVQEIQEVQEEKFVITPKGTRYHVKDCHTAKNIKEYLTKKEAELRGYEPCKICKPQ